MKRLAWCMLVISLAAAGRCLGAPAFPTSRPVRSGTVDGHACLLGGGRSGPAVWRYTFEDPGEEWFLADFDDSAWKEGKAGFGTEDTPGAIVRTRWETPAIWLRREFTVKEPDVSDLAWLIHFDEDAEVYLKNEITFEQLDDIAGSISDNEAARRLNQARNRLFQAISERARRVARGALSSRRR